MEAQVVVEKTSSHKKKKKKSKRSSAAESDASSEVSSSDISFVLQRNNDSIFGDGPSTSDGDKSKYSIPFGVLAVVCCVSSQIMVDE